MMSTQQIQYAEVIRGMKLAMKRKPDDSDSDDSIHAPTNRGNKLKRRAKFVREGRLDTTGGLAYRHQVNHAGYSRTVISDKPLIYDGDGDVYSPNASDAEQIGASPVEEDAFGESALEELLRPLTAAAELPDHPSLSIAYKSKALTQMADEALEMVRREKASLWKAKRLLQRFRGDADWVPCEAFETEQDEMMLDPGTDVQSVAPSVALEQIVPDTESAQADGEGWTVREKVEADAMEGIETMDMALQNTAEVQEPAIEHIETSEARREDPDTTHTNGDSALADLQLQTEDTASADVHSHSHPTTRLSPSRDRKSDTPAEAQLQPQPQPEAEPSAASDEQTSTSDRETNGNAPSHAMTTRARARSPQLSRSPSPTPSDSPSNPTIHPWYLIPPTSLPDKDLGLPATEAEDSRRLLLLYVQKQEQIVRHVESLATGLLRADRLRRAVFRACRAEGHVRDDGKGGVETEMSDGEDWYDPSDWGLLWSDLKMGKNGLYVLEKGKDEVDFEGGAGGEEEGRRGGRRRRVNRM